VARVEWTNIARQLPYDPTLMIADPIRVSILMSVDETPPHILEDSIISVLHQTNPGWELCICDDHSTSIATLGVLEKYRGSDPRIKITRSQTSIYIAKATNRAAEFATGEFVAFLDHDGTLDSNAVEHIIQAINSAADTDILHSDDDTIEPGGLRSVPYLEPDWSPERLRPVTNSRRLLVVRKSLFLVLGGLLDGDTSFQDGDLALRATARTNRVIHIPRMLYHRRELPGSVKTQN
jgi:O-antigen biosynthesis protein